MKTLRILAVLALAACGKDSTSPGTLPTCALKLTLQPAPGMAIGRSAQLHAIVSSVIGKCQAPSPLPSAIDWVSSRPDIVQVTSAGDTVATALAKTAGTSRITASLKVQPVVRDSIDVTVATPVDVADRY